MAEIGKEVRCRLKIIPAKVVVLEVWYYTYACQRCSKENTQTPVVKVAKEPNFIPGGFADPEDETRAAGGANDAEPSHKSAAVPSDGFRVPLAEGPSTRP